MVKEDGMQPGVRRTVRVEQNDGIGLDKCSDMEHVHEDSLPPWENGGNEVRDPGVDLA
jgi:hypothetical protein